MRSRTLGALTIVIVLLLAGASGFLGFRGVQLKKEIGALEEQVEEGRKKAALLQRNYQEKRNLADGLLRAKRTLEAQNVEAQRGLDQLKSELAAVRSDRQAVSETLRKKAAALDAEIQALTGHVSNLAKEKKALEESHALALAGHKAEKERLEAEKGEMETSLKSELKRAYQSLDKSEGNNARLCVIARELLDRYENKSVIGSLMEKEPFTQIKRVELEKLTEEYRERIEQLKVSKKE